MLFRSGCGWRVGIPLISQNPVGRWHGHAENLGCKLTERTHAANGECGKLVGREAGDDAARDAAVTLPVGEECGGRDDCG